MALLIILVCAVILYLLSQGAPYVPTRRKDVAVALELMGLPRGATIVDMGSGDGAVLKVAAEQGYRVIGIELHPLLCMMARLRLRSFGERATVVRGNMWRWNLPEDTAGIFLFTAGPFAKRIQKHLRAQQAKLGRPLIVISLGFELPGEATVERRGACIKYVLE